MRILVTGGAGFIGSHAILALLNKGHDIIVLDNFSNSNSESIRRVEELTGKKITLCEGDIRNRPLLSELFKKEHIYAVMHFAGLKSVSESIKEPLRYYDNNINGTLVLVEEMLKANVRKIIFSSSATVYGTGNVMPIDENSNVGGTTNPYGYSKLVVENILKDIVHSNNLDLVILRYFNPIGAHESGKIGENPNGIPNNIMPYLTQVALGRLQCLQIFGNDYPTHDGTGVRDYIHVMDLAEGHVAALDYIANNTGYQIFNLGTGHGYSVKDLISTFERVTGLKVNTAIAARREGDVAECWANPSKAQQLMKWSAKRNLEMMVKDSWLWQVKNPQGYQ